MINPIATSDDNDSPITNDEPNVNIDSIRVNIDKYLDQLEQSIGSKNSSIRRCNSNSLPSTSNDNQNWFVNGKVLNKRNSLSLDSKGRFNIDFLPKSNIDDVFLTLPFEKSNPNSVSLKLIWRNISCYSKSSSRKVILDNQSGEICAGQLTAIIGPSGAGKSTLLECLAGRKKKGVKGEVYVSHSRTYLESKRKIKISFISQRDQLIETLSVKETLTFASKLKNFRCVQSNFYHPRLVESLLKALNLEKCGDNRVSKISGGQLKRLTLAVELISGPDIILLDEPTSGLDASSTYQCISLLRKLTDLQSSENFYKPPAVVCSIHQPSARVLNIFHQIFVISYDGRCLFQGSPLSLLSHLSKFNLNCPQFHNPADYIIEIASGDYGAEPIDKLSLVEAKKQLQMLSEEKMYLSCNKLMINTQELNEVRIKVSRVINRMKTESFPSFKHFWLLLIRTYLTTIRDQKLTWFRIFQALFIAFLMGFLYDYPIGEPAGCTVPLQINSTSSPYLNHSFQDNIAFIFFITLFTVMACMMPTVLTFPVELTVHIQERNNGWYSCWTYYWSKVIADMPIQTLITVTFSGIIYPMTGQIWSYERFGLFTLVSILIANIAQCVGMLFGTIYVRSVQTAIFMAPLSMAPVFLLSGFFGKIAKVPIFLKPIAIISYVRYAFEGYLVIIYGLGRCDQNVTASGHNLINFAASQNLNANRSSVMIDELNSKVTTSQLRGQYYDKNSPLYTTLPKVWFGFYNPLDYLSYQSTSDFTSTSTGSLVLDYYGLQDYHLWHNLAILCGILIVVRIIAYYILIIKTNEKK